MSFLGNMHEKDNLEGLRKRKSSIIQRQHLPMQINVGGQNWIVVLNLDTKSISSMETNEKIGKHIYM